MLPRNCPVCPPAPHSGMGAAAHPAPTPCASQAHSLYASCREKTHLSFPIPAKFQNPNGLEVPTAVVRQGTSAVSAENFRSPVFPLIPPQVLSYCTDEKTKAQARKVRRLPEATQAVRGGAGVPDPAGWTMPSAAVTHSIEVRRELKASSEPC